MGQSLLVPPLPHNLLESPEIYIGLPDIQAQRRFFQLPLVCQRFRDVFFGSADLPQVLVIQQNLSQSGFLGLRTWLQRHAAHLQSITSLCADDHTIESLLAILAMSHSCLTSASCVIHSTRQLAALGCLCHLTACTLQTSPAIVGLELTPLQCPQEGLVYQPLCCDSVNESVNISMLCGNGPQEI